MKHSTATVFALLMTLGACDGVADPAAGSTSDATRPGGDAGPGGGDAELPRGDGAPATERGLADAGRTDGARAGDAAVALPDGPPPPSVACDPIPATKVIGNWDLVPKQRFAGPFEVGVVAFHEQGVDVEFSVNGAKLATVAHPTKNPRTATYEYWITIDAAAYPDGPITLGATILPDCPAHTPRALEDVVLFADAGGTLQNSSVRWADCQAGDDGSGDGSQAKPYATIEKALVAVGEGGTVYLAAGSCYKTTALYPTQGYARWTTVQPGPGVTREQVTILVRGPGAEGRFGENMVRWKDVRLTKDVAPGSSTLFYLERDHWIWFDGAEIFDSNGRLNGGAVIGGNPPYRVFATGALFRDVMNMNNVCGFCRHVTAKNIGSDVFRARSNTLSIGMTVDTIDKGNTAAHPDFFQFYTTGGTVENIVLYNTRVTDMGAQGIFGGGGGGVLRDMAVVNLVMERKQGAGYLSQLTGAWEHVLLWHVTLDDGPFWLRATAGLKDFWVQNGIWQLFHAGAATDLPGSTIDHNLVRELNWNQPQPLGAAAQVVADPQFVDEAAKDYRLQPGSPAAGAGVPLPGVPVDIDGRYYDPQQPNLGAHAR